MLKVQQDHKVRQAHKVQPELMVQTVVMGLLVLKVRRVHRVM